VDVQFDAEHRYASGDASRINQVISNFVDNALKFMNEGGKLTIGTRLDGRNVLFTVRNDGAPIAEKDLPHIFERFYKADKAHTSGMGTGLGLAICKMIIHEHKSEIRVHSVPGDTAFEFTLPACNPPENRPASMNESIVNMQ
jgi:signal transduction histidine kinase